jgi:hypothetical protein
MEIAVGVVFVIILVYLITISVKVSTGISQTITSQDQVIRLQVLNACGVAGLASRTGARLDSYRGENFEIELTDTDNFEVRDLPRSIIISRIENTVPARLLAEYLGLDPSQVVFRPLENNLNHISVTLILGEDYERVTQGN